MTKFFEHLRGVLKQDERFTDRDGNLLRNKISEAATLLDENLLTLLLNDDMTRQTFFTDAAGVKIFKQRDFVQVVNGHEFLPDSYTRFKNKIGLVDANDNLISQSADVALVFPYKDCLLEGGQTKDDQKRTEIFYNTTLAKDDCDRLRAPKVFANATRYDADGSQPAENFSADDNLIVKGNNLLALASLAERFAGKVKCIYIDPPYYFKQSTATNAFKYNSNFPLSTWLVFMKNRLDFAKRLLCEGGTIWISIGEDGMHYLKVLADDIFGADYFVGTVPRRTRSGKSDVPFNFSQDFDWLLVYTNVPDSEKVIGRKVQRPYFETDDFPGRPWRLADLTSQQPASKRPNSFFTMIDPKTGKEYPADKKRTWAVTKDTFQSYYNSGAIVFPDDYDFLKISKPYARKFKDEDDASGKLSSVISDFQMQDFLRAVLNGSRNSDGNSEIDNLFGRDEFDYAKPENLIKAILDVATNAGDLVLDFFVGSGTTAAVAHKMNRRYIGVEQLDYVQTLTVERLKKVIGGEQGGISARVGWTGGGSFVYCELAELNQSFVEEIERATDTATLEDLRGRIVNSGYISYKVDPEQIDAAAFAELTTDEQKRLLMALLDMNLLYVNLCDIDDADFAISDADKKFTRSFYFNNDTTSPPTANASAPKTTTAAIVRL